MKKLFYLTLGVFLVGLIYLPQSPVARVAKVEASGTATIYDGNTASSTAFSSQRHIVRTTNGTNGRRTFALIATTTISTIGLGLFVTEDPDASTPTWTYVGTISAVAGDNSGDMVWDETNNVLYIVYGKEAPVDSANSDVFFRRVSSIDGSSCNNTTSNCKIGAANITGLNATASINYTHPHVIIGGDSGTQKVIVVGNKHTNCSACGVAGWTVSAGTLNSDAPSWTTLLQIKSWTASYKAGIFGLTRLNTDKVVIFYYDGTNMLASRHDDSAAVGSTSGWDALDGTDNSQTTISSDDPVGNILGGEGSAVGLLSSDVAWFAWLDASNDINTRRWNGSSLDTEMTPIASATSTLGPALTTDDTSLWIIYQDETDATKLVYQKRSATDGTTAWNGTETTLEDSTENLAWPSVGARTNQGSLDVVYTSLSTDTARHTSALVNGPPTLSIAQPDGTSDTVTAGDTYNITYTLSDTDSVVTAAFSYDSDNSGLDGTSISGACASAAEGTGATCSWDTTGVTPGTYYVYGVTSDGFNTQVSAYSSGQITINEAAAPPTVTTDAETNVGITSATLNGNVSALGGSSITARGFAWGTDSSFATHTATTTESGSFGTGTFSQGVSGLLSGVTYYFRAYATNSTGTGYGGSDNFTAGTDTTPSRVIRLFEGFLIKLFSGKFKLLQR